MRIQDHVQDVFLRRTPSRSYFYVLQRVASVTLFEVDICPESEVLVQAVSARPLGGILDLQHKIQFTLD